MHVSCIDEDFISRRHRRRLSKGRNMRMRRANRRVHAPGVADSTFDSPAGGDRWVAFEIASATRQEIPGRGSRWSHWTWRRCAGTAAATRNSWARRESPWDGRRREAGSRPSWCAREWCRSSWRSRLPRTWGKMPSRSWSCTAGTSRRWRRGRYARDSAWPWSPACAPRRAPSASSPTLGYSRDHDEDHWDADRRQCHHYRDPSWQFAVTTSVVSVILFGYSHCRGSPLTRAFHRLTCFTITRYMWA